MEKPPRCVCCGVIVPLIAGLCADCRYYGCRPGWPALECEGGDWPFSEAEAARLDAVRQQHASAHTDA